MRGTSHRGWQSLPCTRSICPHRGSSRVSSRHLGCPPCKGPGGRTTVLPPGKAGTALQRVSSQILTVCLALKTSGDSRPQVMCPPRCTGGSSSVSSRHTACCGRGVQLHPWPSASPFLSAPALSLLMAVHWWKHNRKKLTVIREP